MVKKILIVEDEAALNQALMEFLIEEGFKVLSAQDGERGLEMAQQEMPDLILLDVILPKKDGYEVLDAIKKNEKTKKIPVIMLTNLESQEDILEALEKGATTYLVKSDYRLDDVVKKIKETLKI
jgi:DNA-binding response OmpR family regulator